MPKKRCIASYHFVLHCKYIETSVLESEEGSMHLEHPLAATSDKPCVGFLLADKPLRLEFLVPGLE